jgi:ubiquinone/menaquinone biosynthesis C-methylase UbiE
MLSTYAGKHEMTDWTELLKQGYDSVAREYLRDYKDDLKNKPLEQEMLARLAKSVSAMGPVCDLGCGPGQAAAMLHKLGARAFGIDISPAMVEGAARLHPEIEFKVGNMYHLEVEDNSLGGVVMLYSLSNVPRQDVVPVFREIGRVLVDHGQLMIAVHKGESVYHRTEWYGRPVCIDWTFFTRDELRVYLSVAGFEFVELVERKPYPDVEHQCPRLCIRARKTPVLRPSSPRI